jgi:hypothetical protein
MASSLFGKQSVFELVLECYNQFKGRQFGVMFMFRSPVIYVTDLELLKTIAVKDFEYFTDHRTDFINNSTEVISKALIILKGE